MNTVMQTGATLANAKFHKGIVSQANKKWLRLVINYLGVTIATGTNQPPSHFLGVGTYDHSQVVRFSDDRGKLKSYKLKRVARHNTQCILRTMLGRNTVAKNQNMFACTNYQAFRQLNDYDKWLMDPESVFAAMTKKKVTS